jgi:ligand-binding SRPBCC domain-containing protein
VEQFISSSMEKAWDFFSNPQNLQKITPANMGFQITSGDTGRAYPGQIITTRLKYFH